MYLNDPLIKKKINEKARWVHRYYPNLEVADMRQEGYELLLKLDKEYGETLPLPYILAAISYHFSNIMRKARVRRKYVTSLSSTFTSLQSGVTEDVFIEIENNADRERFRDLMTDKKFVAILNYLFLGFKPKEIAKKMKMHVRTVYRKIAILQQLREVWEENKW